MKPARKSFLLIAMATAMFLQSHSTASAHLLHHFNDTAHTQNGSSNLVGEPNSTSAYNVLPYPSNCDTHTFMDSSLFEENTTMKLFNFTENPQPPANRNLSLDDGAHANNNTAPCIEITSKIEEQYGSLDQHKVPTEEKESMEELTVLGGDDNVILIYNEQLDGVTDQAPDLNVPLGTPDRSAAPTESLQVMVIGGDDDAILVNVEQLAAARGATPPPGSGTPIHTAASMSVARDSLHVMIHEHDIAAGEDHRRRLRGATPAGGNSDTETPIHTKLAKSSIGTEPVKFMMIDDDDDAGVDEVVIVDNTRLSRATPPPGTITPIHTAASISVARDQSMQVTVKDDGNAILTIDEEQLVVTTPPPGSSTPIHTAALRSVARDSGMQVTVISDDDDDDDDVEVVLMQDVP